MTSGDTEKPQKSLVIMNWTLVILIVEFDLHFRMWVPGNLPPNLVFFIVVTTQEGRSADGSDSSNPIAADAPDQASHFQDRDGGQYSVDR